MASVPMRRPVEGGGRRAGKTHRFLCCSLEGGGVKRNVRLMLGTTSAVALLIVSLVAGNNPTGAGARVQNRVLAHALNVELGRVKADKFRQQLSAGVMYTLLQATGELDRRAKSQVAGAPLGRSLGTVGCRRVLGGLYPNVRVNQDCTFRRQAEETIAINPTNPRNLIAGQNDSRIGFNHCGYDFSFDGGATWGDQIPPFWSTLLLDDRTTDACSDPTAAFDSKGNAYAGGIIFNVFSNANAILVEKSNAPIGGAFYHTPTPGPFQLYSTDPAGIVANDNDNIIFNDKELMTTDTHPGSPKADNVYMTWTRFTDTDSPIYFSQSTNGGATWSPGVEISGSNPAICTAGSGEQDPNACDQDQSSHPIVGSDGTVYVSFVNSNTPAGTTISQDLVVKCPAAADCSNKANWTTPVKISDEFRTQPFGPDPLTACSAGRRCLPPNGYRLASGTGSLSIDRNGVLYFVWSDFRNGGPPCDTGDAKTSTPPCNNDVFYSVSTNGGATWGPALLITPKSAFGKTAQWQPWSAVSVDGKTLWVGFYDRRYGNCEFSGCNDITLAQIGDPNSHPTFSYARLTTSSMPNLIPANNPVQAGFLGDYMWVATHGNSAPYVVWGDTRGRGGAVEEDIYFAR